MKVKKAKYDSAWKLILEKNFPHIMAFLFPAVANQIDWEKPYESLDKELLAIQKEEKIGGRLADKLMKVYKKDGEQACVLVHVEIQGKSEKSFSKRMFVYHYRIFDRYDLPIMSLAILTDSDKTWRPNFYEHSLWGCSLNMTYPIIKLLDFASKTEMLEESLNPIAKVLQVHLAALQSKGKSNLRYVNKLKLIKSLYSIGYNQANRREYIHTLFLFIDYAMKLPKELETKLICEMKEYESEVNMQHMTTFEKFARKEGKIEGKIEEREEILKLLLEKKFGTSSNHYINNLKVENLNLEEIIQSILNSNKIEDVFLQHDVVE